MKQVKKLKEDKGFILKKTPIKEKGAFFQIFTFNDGKKSFFVNDFKKSKKNYSAYFSIGNKISFTYSEKTATPTISEVSLLYSSEADFKKLQSLSYFLELTSHFSQEEQQNEKIYHLLNYSISFLSLVDLDLIKLFFEIRLLTTFGFLAPLNFYGDTHKKIQEKKENFFDQKNGHFSENQNFDSLTLRFDLVKLLYFLQTGEVEKIFSLKVKKEDLLKLKNIFKTTISTYCPNNLKALSCFSD